MLKFDGECVKRGQEGVFGEAEHIRKQFFFL